MNHYLHRQFKGEVRFRAGDDYRWSCGDAGVYAGWPKDQLEIGQVVTQSVGSCEGEDECLEPEDRQGRPRSEHGPGLRVLNNVYR